jgi:hypothetical protein
LGANTSRIRVGEKSCAGNRSSTARAARSNPSSPSRVQWPFVRVMMNAPVGPTARYRSGDSSHLTRRVPRGCGRELSVSCGTRSHTMRVRSPGSGRVPSPEQAPGASQGPKPSPSGRNLAEIAPWPMSPILSRFAGKRRHLLTTAVSPPERKVAGSNRAGRASGSDADRRGLRRLRGLRRRGASWQHSGCCSDAVARHRLA